MAHEAPGRLDAVHDRHAQVHHDDVRPQSADGLDGRSPVGRLTDDLDVGLVGHDHPEARADQLLVVHQQDPDPVAHPAFPGWGSRGSHAATRKPRPTGPASRRPPNRAARSRIPMRP